jgi:precorrin-2 dehydrogenase/sirohydrochlorin ferrochelatase
MSYIVNLVLEGRGAVVVGGGEVAGRKVDDLLAAKASVTVIAPHACARILTLADQKQIQAHWRQYRTGDLSDTFVAVAATDDEEVNAQVSRDAAARNVLVNVVDRPALCTFTVPATVHRGDLTVAVATEGRCPALASILREEIEQQYGPEYAGLVDLFARLRQQMTALGWEGSRIRGTLAGIYWDGVARLLAGGDSQLRNEFLRLRLGSAFRLSG